MTPKKKKHPEHPPVPAAKKEIKRLRVIAVASIIFLIFGTGIAWFAAGDNITWLITGGIAGAFCGFFIWKADSPRPFKKIRIRHWKILNSALLQATAYIVYNK